MEVQTLTFNLRGMTERQAYHYAESLRLGIGEHDGLVRWARSRRNADGSYVIFCVWKDSAAVANFRHSELYARFALSPNVVNLEDAIDRVFVDRVTDDMIALAA